MTQIRLRLSHPTILYISQGITNWVGNLQKMNRKCCRRTVTTTIEKSFRWLYFKVRFDHILRCSKLPACLLAVLAATNHYRLHFTVFDCSLHLQASLTKLLLQKQQANERMNERTDKEQVTAAVKDYYQYSFNPHQIIKKTQKIPIYTSILRPIKLTKISFTASKHM